jgi:hypothetical protein
MQNNAAVFRTQETLEEGCHLIDETVASFEDVKVGGREGVGGAGGRERLCRGSCTTRLLCSSALPRLGPVRPPALLLLRPLATPDLPIHTHHGTPNSPPPGVGPLSRVEHRPH